MAGCVTILWTLQTSEMLSCVISFSHECNITRYIFKWKQAMKLFPYDFILEMQIKKQFKIFPDPITFALVLTPCKLYKLTCR